MIHVDSKPADLGESGWNAILPPRHANPALEREIDCDYLVVGAGFAGLSAARRIAQLEPQASIVILEAHQVATGPAGRNSGFMIDLPHALATGGYAGEDSQDLRNIRMNRAAIAFAADCARDFGFPDEAFDPSGKINAAADRHGLRHNTSYARHLEALGEPFEFLDATAMQAICGSHYYRGGLKTPGTATRVIHSQPVRCAGRSGRLPTVREFGVAIISAQRRTLARNDGNRVGDRKPGDTRGQRVNRNLRLLPASTDAHQPVRVDDASTQP